MSVSMDTRLLRALLACSLLGAACGDDSPALPDAHPPHDGPVDGPIVPPDPDARTDGMQPPDPDGGADAPVDGGTPQNPGTIGDNGRILDGAPVNGTGPSLRKQLAVETLDGGVADLEVGRGFATKSSATATRVKTMFEITNRGTRTYCLVGVVDVEYLDAQGAPLADATSIYIAGSVQRTSPTATASTCLAPGERAFALDIADTAVGFDRLSGVRFHTFAQAAPGATAPSAKLRPTAYTVTGNDVSVTVENTGTRTGAITDVEMVPLDADGAPLGWDSLLPVDRQLAAGASTTARNPHPLFTGSSTRIYVRVAYADM